MHCDRKMSVLGQSAALHAKVQEKGKRPAAQCRWKLGWGKVPLYVAAEKMWERRNDGRALVICGARA